MTTTKMEVEDEASQHDGDHDLPKQPAVRTALLTRVHSCLVGILDSGIGRYRKCQAEKQSGRPVPEQSGILGPRPRADIDRRHGSGCQRKVRENLEAPISNTLIGLRIP